MNAFRLLGLSCDVSGDPGSLEAARALVLPGVGAFGAAMANLQASGLDVALREQVLVKKKPFLGVCLGMQLLAEDSTELGYHKGLGWIPGNVVRMAPRKGLPVPHVGWNTLESSEFPREAHFYFDHSYHFQCAPEWVLATCEYGGKWVAAVRRDNILGVQFHPEKSQRSGLKLLRKFVSLSKRGNS